MGTVRLSEIELSAEDDIGTFRLAEVAVEVDAPEPTGTFRVAGVAIESDEYVIGTFRVATLTLETGELPDTTPGWFWGSGPGKWRPRLAYKAMTGDWT